MKENITDKEKEIIYKIYNKFIEFKNDREEIPVNTTLQEFMNFINY